MPDVVITEFMDEGGVAELKRLYDTVYDPDLVKRPDEIERLVQDARALVVRNRTQVTPALLDAGPKLKVVGRLGVGLDNIDLEACKARGIAVCPATGANNVSVAEYVMTALLLLLRGRTFTATPDVVAGKWPRTEMGARDASGKRLGLAGFGAIGRDVAVRAQALGMTVAAYDPYLPAGDPAWRGVERMELADLIRTSDVISLHVPLSAETRHMIDREALATMKPDAIVINAARGGVVDEPALVAALRDGRIGGAVLDVFEEEPLTAETAKLFTGVPNLILTPHVAGVTHEAGVRTGVVVIAGVRRALEGKT